MTTEATRLRHPQTRLRLVTAGPHQAGLGLDAGLLPMLKLSSVAAVGKPVLLRGVMADLLAALETHHVVELRHDVFSAAGRPHRYQMGMYSNATGALANDCASALRIACPTLGWDAAGSACPPAPQQALSFRAGILLAATRVFTVPGAATGPHLLPTPAALPDWRLTEIFNPSLGLPDHLQLSIRLMPYRLQGAECEHAWRVMQLLGSNLSRAVHPGVDPSPFTASEALKSELITLLQAWLARPNGYTVSVQIAASSALDSMALSHIARDVFGARPFEVDSRPGAEEVVLGFQHAVRIDQGLPALLPEERHAAALGVCRHFPDAGRQLEASGFQIGMAASKAAGAPVHLPCALRSRHVALVGASGTGKSSLMLNMILNDLQDPNRPGVVLIDPHGDLYQAVLAGLPEERRADVALVDVTDTEHSACINPLAMGHGSPATRAYLNNQILELIDLLFEVEQSRGPVTNSHILAMLNLAASYPGRAGTFLDCLRLLREPVFAEWLITKLKASQPESVAHWTTFQKTSGDQSMANWVPHLAARFTPFTGSPAMKRLLCRPNPTVDFQAIFRERKIVLFNFSKSVLQDIETRVASSLALMQLFGASLARAHMPAEDRFPVHLYVDEFQSIATASTGKILAEARKFNLGMTVAFQNLAQLKSRFSGDLTGALLANTATKLLFRLSPGDAQMLDDYYKPQLEAADMTGMPDFHAACVMPAQMSANPAFVMRCLPPQEMVPGTHDATGDWSEGSRGTSVSAANQELLRLYEIPLSNLEHT